MRISFRRGVVILLVGWLLYCFWYLPWKGQRHTEVDGRTGDYTITNLSEAGKLTTIECTITEDGTFCTDQAGESAK